MGYRIAADCLVLIHFAFILFIALGGLLVFRWKRLAWIHIPCVLWGVLIEFCGWICPLTPLENRLRLAAGDQGFSGGFIEHYLLPVVYPGFLTRGVQLILGAAVILINVVLYAILVGKVLGKRRKQ